MVFQCSSGLGDELADAGQMPPPSTPCPGVEPRAPRPADPAPATRPGPRAHRDHRDLCVLIEPGVLRHRLLASDQRLQYRGEPHAVLPARPISSLNTSRSAQGTACTASGAPRRPTDGAEEPLIGGGLSLWPRAHNALAVRLHHEVDASATRSTRNHGRTGHLLAMDRHRIGHSRPGLVPTRKGSGLYLDPKGSALTWAPPHGQVGTRIVGDLGIHTSLHIHITAASTPCGRGHESGG